MSARKTLRPRPPVEVPIYPPKVLEPVRPAAGGEGLLALGISLSALGALIALWIYLGYMAQVAR